MRYPEFGRVQHEPMDAEFFAGQLVLPTIAVSGIADNGMTQMRHMATQLVGPPRFRPKFDEAKAGTFVATNWIRQFDGGESPVIRDCGLLFFRNFLGSQGVVDHASGIRPAAHDSVIKLLRPPPGKLLANRSAGLSVQCEEQDPTRRSVQPMTGVHRLANLVAQHLHSKLGSLTIQHRPMHKETARLVYGNELIILVKYLEWF